MPPFTPATEILTIMLRMETGSGRFNRMLLSCQSATCVVRRAVNAFGSDLASFIMTVHFPRQRWLVSPQQADPPSSSSSYCFYGWSWLPADIYGGRVHLLDGYRTQTATRCHFQGHAARVEQYQLGGNLHGLT